MPKIPSNGNNEKHGSDENCSSLHSRSSHPSHQFPRSPGNMRVIPPRGDYQTLLSYQKAEAIFDITFRFPISSCLKATAPSIK
jgi:hypothetical protein